MTSQDLSEWWESAAAAVPLVREMTFDGDVLRLGARTPLAKVGAPWDEARLAALLAAAHGRSVAAAPLRYLQRAVETWPTDRPLALTHLALSGLAKLANPGEDARRLFLADALMEAASRRRRS